MSDYSEALTARLQTFCKIFHVTPARRLGFGKDGTVWLTTTATALKVYERQYAFDQELAVYQRLADHGITNVHGHAVPQLTIADPVLGVIEMTTVEPPFLLDFASARLDEPVDFPEDVLEEWRQSKREEFGPDWPQVIAILRALERLGIYMTDVHAGNIRFRNDPPSPGPCSAPSS